MPSAALAVSNGLQPIPGGSEGVVSVASSVEGGDADTFSHYLSEESSSADGDGAAITPAEGETYINEDVPLAATARGYVEIDLLDEPAGTPIEGKGSDEALLSLEERDSSSAGVKQYHVLFDKNGGDWAPAYSNDVVATYGGVMPDITGYLASEGSVPKREKYVFMGWYDSSVWNSPTATRYYDRDFRDCGKTYPYAADGLRLYAGWAPVLDYTVPTSVSIAVGTVPELGAPTVAAGEIVNRSPWPIECTAITWDATPLSVDESHLIAAEAQIEGLLAKSVQMSASTLDEMFSPLSGVYLDMATESASASVSPKGTTDTSFRVEAETTAPVTYTISLAEGTAVKATEKVSRTTLLTPFQAVIDSPDAVLSTILFDAGEGTGGQSESLKAEKGMPLPPIDKNPPVYDGRTFKGWFDSPDWERATCYYDATGEPVQDVWDKDADTCLYASWEIKGCPVLFLAGGEGATLAYGETLTSMLVSVEYGKTLGTVQGFGGRLPEPHWGAYTFIGWYDDEGKRYEADDVMHGFGETLVLTARWSGVPVKVTWDAAGGASVDSWDAFPSGSALGSYGAIPKTTREGYIFGGWWANGTQASTNTVIASDTTFIARWTGKTITLSWDIDGTIVATSTQTYGTGADGRPITVAVSIDLVNPSKGQEGWSFRGWFDGAGIQLSTDTPLPTDNATYYAKWNAYISFDVNGGTFAGTDPSGFMACGEKVFMPSNPSRTGYTFAGWWTEQADGTQATNQTDVTVPATFYAHWTGENITVNWNGGNVPTEAATEGFTVKDVPTTATVERGSTLGSALASAPTLDHCVFQGWFTAATGGDEVTADTIIDPAGKSATYYAQWVYQPNPSTVTFDLGVGSWTGPSSITMQYGNSLEDLSSYVVTPKTGYTFEGFFDDANNRYYNTSLVASKTKWDKASPIVTLHASYAPKSYDVTYNTNEGAASRTETVKVGFDGALTAPVLGTPTRTGYTFKGWFDTDATTGGNQYVPGTTKWTIDGGQTLYARWKANENTITLDHRGGTNSVDSVTATYGQQLPQVPVPAKAGYAFMGYFSATSGGDKCYTGSGLSNGPWEGTSNITIYAQWELSPYNITYSGVDGATNDNPKGYNATNLPLTLADAEKEHYTFDGWTGNGTTTPTKGLIITSGTTGDLTFTAHWTPVTYNITYVDNKDRDQAIIGRSSTNGPATYTIETDTITLAQPTSTNYDFAGWIGEGITTPTKSVTIPKGSFGNRAYTAYWTIKTYTLTYTSAAGGQMVGGWNALTSTVDYGSTHIVTSAVPTRNNYDFVGWSTSENATTATYKAGNTITVTSNLKLWAVWKAGFGGTSDMPEPLDDWGGNFYLHLTADQAKDINTNSSSPIQLETKEQYIDAATIKIAANDISDKGEQSDYYKMFEYIMFHGSATSEISDDILFTATWRDVTASNHNNLITSPSSFASTGSDYSVRLIGLRQDYINDAKTTFAGMTFQFADLGLDYYRYNKTHTSTGGWSRSELRARMNSDNSTNATQSTMTSGDASARCSIWDRAPQSITKNMQPVYKISHNDAGNANNTASAISTTRDQFFLTSYWEMASTNNKYSSYPWITKEVVSGTQYQYWKSLKIKGNTESPYLIKGSSYLQNGTLSAGNWWGRSTFPGVFEYVFAIGWQGLPYWECSVCDPAGSDLVVPCWCF